MIGLKSTVLNNLFHFDEKECIGVLKFTLLKCAVEEIKIGCESDVMMVMGRFSVNKKEKG